MRITVDHDRSSGCGDLMSTTPPTTWAAGLEGALDPYSRAYDLDAAEDGQAVRAYVGRVLEVFSRWDTPARLRFLRIRGLSDAFIPAGVEFYGPLERAGLEARFADRPDHDFATLIRRPDDRFLPDALEGPKPGLGLYGDATDSFTYTPGGHLA